jgi:hypothetical protein
MNAQGLPFPRWSASRHPGLPTSPNFPSQGGQDAGRCAGAMIVGARNKPPWTGFGKILSCPSSGFGGRGRSRASVTKGAAQLELGSAREEARSAGMVAAPRHEEHTIRARPDEWQNLCLPGGCRGRRRSGTLKSGSGADGPVTQRGKGEGGKWASATRLSFGLPFSTFIHFLTCHSILLCRCRTPRSSRRNCAISSTVSRNSSTRGRAGRRENRARSGRKVPRGRPDRRGRRVMMARRGRRAAMGRRVHKERRAMTGRKVREAETLRLAFNGLVLALRRT